MNSKRAMQLLYYLGIWAILGMFVTMLIGSLFPEPPTTIIVIVGGGGAGAVIGGLVGRWQHWF